MPICDGYKATHLLRHHGPYKAFMHDVPIVAMTASAIQGDQEKCRRAGMDDYLAKPVKSKILEKMLVRWSIDRRTAPTPQHNSSEVSDCSEGSEDCNNADIPGVGVDDDSDSVTPGAGRPQDEDASDELAASRSSLPTPRAPSSSDQSFFPSTAAQASHGQQSVGSDLSPSTPGKPELQFRRVETDEMAQQSRDDKLIDAAGGASVTPLTHTPLAEKGDSLTAANVEKFEREELRRRLTSEDGRH